MFTISHQDYVFKTEYYADQAREADKARLVRQVLAGRAQNRRFHSCALAWLGQHLVAWGRRLQERYGPRTALPHSANRAAG